MTFEHVMGATALLQVVLMWLCYHAGRSTGYAAGLKYGIRAMRARHMEANR